jgi:exosortase/archaeosortase family protein
VSGYSISSPRYSLTIARGCDAFEPCALFASGVLAFPAPWLSKIPGVLIGVLSIMALNITRIVTLFYVGVYWPKIFHIMHVDVWQTLFILFAIVFWTLWALRATRVRSPILETVAPDH